MVSMGKREERKRERGKPESVPIGLLALLCWHDQGLLFPF
jgi:hypothetical protein